MAYGTVNVNGVTTADLKLATEAAVEAVEREIPTVNNPTITITQNGESKGTFKLNQAEDGTIDLSDENTTYSTMGKASELAGGAAGLVPASNAGDQNKFLKADGTWGVPADTIYTAGEGLSLSNNQFSVKTGGKVLGKTYPVISDKSGNLVVSVPWTDTVPTWSDLEGKPTLADVATSGSYEDLSDKPSIRDTRDTAGSGESSAKLYLIGANSQSELGAKTYSNSSVYQEKGVLYSGNEPVATQKLVENGAGTAPNLSAKPTMYTALQIGKAAIIFFEATGEECLSNSPSDELSAVSLYFHGLGESAKLGGDLPIPVGRARITTYASKPTSSSLVRPVSTVFTDVMASKSGTELLATMTGVSIPAGYAYAVQMNMIIPMI